MLMLYLWVAFPATRMDHMIPNILDRPQTPIETCGVSSQLSLVVLFTSDFHSVIE